MHATKTLSYSHRTASSKTVLLESPTLSMIYSSKVFFFSYTLTMHVLITSVSGEGKLTYQFICLFMYRKNIAASIALFML